MAFVVHDLKNPVNSVDLHAQVLQRDRDLSAEAQDSVTQIKDVAGPSSSAPQKIVNLVAKFRNRCEQRNGVEISLNGGPIGNVHPRLIDVDAPVAAHDVSTGCVKFPEITRGAGTEVNHRDTARLDALDQRARVWLREPNIIVARQGAYPAIENLNGTGP